jgi:transposase
VRGELATMFGLFPFEQKPTTAIKGCNSASGWRRCCLSFQSKSSNVQTPHAASRLYLGGGVERTIAWLSRCRRLAKDFENRTRIALAFLKPASIRLMLSRLSKSA